MFLVFYYVLIDIGVVCFDCEENIINLGKICEFLELFCEKDYNEVSEDFFVKDNCFGVNYIYELLIEGYGFSGLKKIIVINLLNGFSLG